MENNLELWKRLEMPPDWAKKTIGAGRLKGKTDINPQWRYLALTEEFGICGIGWKYEIEKMWTEPGGQGEVMCFVIVSLYFATEVCIDGVMKKAWSAAIPGIGGHMIVQKESSGLHANDEGFKMATTDALSVACKMIGVGAAIYSGESYSKYAAEEERAAAQKEAAQAEASARATLDAENEALLYRWLAKATELAHVEAISAKIPDMKLSADVLKRVELAIQTRKNEIGAKNNEIGAKNNG